MIRNTIWLLLGLAAAVAVALLLQNNHGHVAVLWPPYRVELSNNAAVLMLLASFVVLYLLLRLVFRVVGAPDAWRARRVQKADQRSTNALQNAMLALYEGRYEQAEKLALTAGDRTITSGTAALIAARSAHRLGAYDRRDGYLRSATRDEETQAAALQTQAEFALEDHRPERAIAAVDRMSSGGSPQVVALETALDAYQQSGQWDRVMETLRQIGQRGGLSEAEVSGIRSRAYARMLAPREGDARAIREMWKSLNSQERKATELAAQTVAALARADAHEDARKIALSVLDSGYDAGTVEAFGSMAAIPARARLEQLERWRSAYGDQPKLLEMLGRICAGERLWGQGESYLLSSLGAEDSVSCRVALGQLYDATQRRADAAAQYEAGARLAIGERVAVPTASRTPVGGAAVSTGTGAGDDSSVVLGETAAEAHSVGMPEWKGPAPETNASAAQVNGTRPEDSSGSVAPKADDLPPKDGLPRPAVDVQASRGTQA